MRPSPALASILIVTASALPCRAQLAAPAAPPACTLPIVRAPGDRPATARRRPEALQAAGDAATSDPSVLTAAEPPNLSIVRDRLYDYYDCVGNSGCYWADLDAQLVRADSALTVLLLQHNATTPEAAAAQKLAIILDLDETSLSSYCEEKHEDLGYIHDIFEAWIVSPQASVAIPGTLRLFNHARAAGVSVFFLTGRPGAGYPNDQTAATARNLATAGYKDWQGLIMRPPSYTSAQVQAYKSTSRVDLAKKYTLLLNVGDQWSDLAPPGRAEINVKLPNPFYFLP